MVRRWVVSEVGILVILVVDGCRSCVGLEDGRFGDARLEGPSVMESGLGAACER